MECIVIVGVGLSNIELRRWMSVMELYWDYDYYQPWTNNEWMVNEMLAIRDEVDKDNTMDGILAHQ